MNRYLFHFFLLSFTLSFGFSQDCFSMSPNCLNWILELKNKNYTSLTKERIIASGLGINDLGDFDYCRKQEGNTYFLFNLQMNATNVNFAMCFPNFCTAKEINACLPLVDQYLASIIQKKTESKVEIAMTATDPTQNDQSVSAGSVVAIIFFVGLTTFSLFVSIVNYLQKTNEKEAVKGIPKKVFDSFDLVSNFYSLFEMPSSLRKNPLKAFNGIRFFAISWVILGHVYFTMLEISPSVNAGFKDAQEPGFFNIAVGGFYAVDIFFGIGGFFVAYVGVPKLKNSTLSVMKYIMIIIHRLLRILPCYGTLIFFMGYILYLVSNGPLWSSIIDTSMYCRENGFYDLIFATNFIIGDKPICVGWGWYIALDMQIFIFTPIILFIHKKNKTFGYISTAVFVIACFITTFAVTMANNYKALVNLSIFANHVELNNFYFKPWFRADPYFLGVACGLLYMDIKDDEDNFIRKFYSSFENAKSIITYILGLGIMAFLLFIVSPIQKDSNNWSQVQHSFFMTFNRFTFVLALFIFMVPQIFLKESYVRELLGSRFFNPTAKLAYCIYLVHYVVLYMIFYSRNKAIYYTTLEFVNRALELLFFSIIAAIILFLLIEKPVANLERILEGDSKRNNRNEKSEVMFEGKKELLLPK